jgi:phenylalanyl-tRNA synthetase beta subunit
MIITLSGEEKKLAESMMVIADTEKALAIAGVKGGSAAEVTHDTKFVVLEVANFEAASIRKTSRSLGLVTDASKRFENNLSPIVVEAARAKLVGLVTLLAGGTVSAASDHYPNPHIDRAISFTLEDIQRLLGPSVTDLTITKVLDQYGYTYEHTEDFYTLDVPYWRQDITGAHDMAEEIGRVTGYDSIEAKPIPFVPSIVLNEQYEKIRTIKFSLLKQGYSEVMTYAFRKKGDVTISYGPKDKSALRTNLTEAMKESYELNKANAALLGVTDVKQFEIGTVFTADNEQINIAIADKSGIKEWSVDEYYQANKDQLIEVDANTEAARMLHGIEKKPFTPWSNYPFITRDIAVWVTEGHAGMLETMVQEFATKHCARSAVLFDRFSKDGKTSLAYRLVFQSKEKTLTDAEVDATFAELVTAITAAGLTIR